MQTDISSVLCCGRSNKFDFSAFGQLRLTVTFKVTFINNYDKPSERNRLQHQFGVPKEKLELRMAESLSCILGLTDSESII